LPHVFDRFDRVDDARSREDGGAGLGLAICRSIVQAHSGDIEIESRLGEGTIVTVILPNGVEPKTQAGLLGASAA
jgi:signal transduction histidine kinase